MTLQEDLKTLRRARASFALALIFLAGGVAFILGGQSGSGLILAFAGVAGVMTATQLRRLAKQRSTDN